MSPAAGDANGEIREYFSRCGRIERGEGEPGGGAAVGFHPGEHLLNLPGVGGGEVLGFTGVGIEVEKHRLAGWFSRGGLEVVLDQLPPTIPHGAATVVFVGLPVKRTAAIGHFPAAEEGSVGVAVEGRRRSDAGKLAGGGEEIDKTARLGAGGGFFDPGRPVGNEGDADAALEEVAFAAAERAVGLQHAGMVTALEVRAIVAGEEDQGVLIEALAGERGGDLADGVIERPDQGGVVGLGVGDRGVVGLPRGFSGTAGDGSGRSEHGGVGDGVGEEQEKGAFGGLGLDEAQRLAGVEVDVVVAAAVEGVAGEFDALFLIVDETGVAPVAIDMAGGAVEDVEALGEHVGGVLGVSGDAGFADHGGAVAGVFEQAGDGGVGGIRPEGELAIAADGAVAGVEAGHERAAGWRADGGTGIVVGETQA